MTPERPYLIVLHGANVGLEPTRSVLNELHNAGFAAGAALPIPAFIPATAADYFAEFAQHAEPSLADPMTHVFSWEEGQRGGQREKWKYMQVPDPASRPAPFTSAVLSAQLEVGAETLVTPWLAHGFDGGTRNLQATLSFAEHGVSSPLAQGRRVLLGASVAASVLADSRARSDYLNALVEFPEGDFYLRVHQSGNPAYSQPRDVRVLAGLRHVVSALRENDRGVLLPQSGLLGYAMSAFGAHGFGAGIPASLQSCCEPQRGGSGVRLPWYFVPELLTFVLRDDLSELQGLSGYHRCDCVFCRSLLEPGGVWDFNEAGQHFLYSLARMANDMPEDPNERITALRRRLDAAATLREELQSAGRLLDARSEPKHLEAWSAALT